MKPSMFPARRSILLLAAITGLFLVVGRTTADPTPGQRDRVVIELVCDALHRYHLTRPEIGDELSRKLFQRFIKDLDPSKMYFVKSDIDEFKKSETELDDQLQQGDITFAYQVYSRLLARMGERVKLVEELLKAPQDFTIKEYMSTDYKAMDYTNSPEELKERWRKRVKYDLLLQKLGDKPVPDEEAKHKVLTRYQSLYKRWKQVDNYDLMEMYLSDLTASVDPHSSYMSPSTLADFDIAMHLNLEGIGALLRSDNGYTTISEIIPGGAAATDHRLKVNDKIIAVAQGDGKWVDVVDWKLTEVVKLIRGPRGTKVQLKVIPVGKVEPVVYNYTRQKVELKAQAARSEIVDQGKKPDGKPYRIGVIDLPSFYAESPSGRDHADAKSATEDVRAILKEFKAKGVDGVILDLRRNGGGSLNEAISLTGLFIDKGPVVQVKGHRGVLPYNDPERGMAYAGPLAVLVSRMSASASEILAGALQDYDRALIVGDKSTHGKGTVQVVVDLGGQVDPNDPPKLGALKLTIQQFYRVNGDSTQNKGVASDVTLPSLIEALATEEKDLDNALAFDKVKSLRHDEMNMVPEELKSVIRARSAERVKNSPEFAKLVKDIETAKAQRARKSVSLNEKELRGQVHKDKKEKKDGDGSELLDDDSDGLSDDAPPSDDKITYKFQRNFTNNEILHIVEDLIQGKKLLPH